MRAIMAGYLTIAILSAVPVSARPIPVDLELVLAVDVSGSIDAKEAQLQRQGYVEAIANPDVVRAIKSGVLGRIAVSYFEWAGDGWQIPIVDWTLISGRKTAERFAIKLAAAPLSAGPWTSISDAIRFAVLQLGENAFEGTRRIIDISGDGPNNLGGLVVPARDMAVSKRITINGLPIINERLNFSRSPMPNLDLYYRHCVIGGPGAFIVIAHGFNSFARAIRRKLILEIAGSRDRSVPVTIKSPELVGLNKRFIAPNLHISYTPRWVPPCDEGERRFRGVIDDE